MTVTLPNKRLLTDGAARCARVPAAEPQGVGQEKEALR
jgi:hypothetical protein